MIDADTKSVAEANYLWINILSISSKIENTHFPIEIYLMIMTIMGSKACLFYFGNFLLFFVVLVISIIIFWKVKLSLNIKLICVTL